MAKATPHRVVLLTGAAGGIGSQTARRLVEAGHRVALVDIDGPGSTDCPRSSATARSPSRQT